MKKNTTKNLSKRLLKYGALSAAILGVADASGQVVYTDLDPDVELDVADALDIDYTGDATVNVNIQNPDGLTGGNAAIVFPSSGGAFVGITAGGFEYPALMFEDEVIDDAATYTTTGVRGDLNYYGCAYSNSAWCSDIEDGYLGVQFQFNGNTHYGWVRMDTDVGGDNLITVKDHAFQSTPGAAILAGEEDTAGIVDSSFNNFRFFNNSNELTMDAKVSLDNVTIYNIAGQVVINQKLSSTVETVNISGLSNGAYIVKVAIDGEDKSFKIAK